MFATHPNKSKIKFLLIPIIKEGLYASNDLTNSSEYLYSLFGQERAQINNGIVFDFSLLRGALFGENKIWNFNVLTELETIQGILKNLDETSETHS